MLLLPDGCICSLLPLTASDDIPKHQYMLVLYWFMPGCSVVRCFPDWCNTAPLTKVSVSPDFIESQTGLSWKGPSATPCHRQGHLPLSQAAPSPIQAGLVWRAGLQQHHTLELGLISSKCPWGASAQASPVSVLLRVQLLLKDGTWVLGAFSLICSG